MTARKIEIADDLWGRVRVRAFETNTTAAALVTTALENLLAGPQTKASSNSSDGAPVSARPPKENGVRQVAAALDVPVTIVTPTREAAQETFDATKEMLKEDPWKELTKPLTITTPEEAARVAATLQPIRPVPKPTSKSRPSRRSTGKSS